MRQLSAGNDTSPSDPLPPAIKPPYRDYSNSIRFLHGSGMSEKRLTEIYGARAVHLALGLPT